MVDAQLAELFQTEPTLLPTVPNQQACFLNLVLKHIICLGNAVVGGVVYTGQAIKNTATDIGSGMVDAVGDVVSTG